MDRYTGAARRLVVRRIAAAVAVAVVVTGCGAQQEAPDVVGSVEPPEASPVNAPMTLDEIAALGLSDEERMELLAGLAASEPIVTLYSSSQREGSEAWVESFRRRFPDVAVQYVNMEPEDISPRLLAERAAGRRTADVVYTSTPGLGDLLARGALEQHHDVIVPDGQFRELVHPAVNTLRIQAQVIGWSTGWRSATDGPRSYEDLLLPEFSGCVLTDSPSWVSLMVQRLGEQGMRAWFQAFLDNGGVMAESASRQLRRLAVGEIDCQVLSRASAIRNLIDDGASLTWSTPEPTLAFSHGVALVEGSRSPYGAALLALWISQPEQVAALLGFSGGSALHPGVAEFLDDEEAVVTTDMLGRSGLVVLDVETAGDLARTAFSLLAEYHTPNLLGP
jgi:ABC-type Fe3+ transport system substrate-binding protein